MSVEEIITRLGIDMSSEDGQVRKSAISKAVGELFAFENLSNTEIASVGNFLLSKLDDWASVGGACDGLLFLLRSYGNCMQELPNGLEPENIDSDLLNTLDLSKPLHASTSLIDTILKKLLLSVHAPSFAQSVRLSVLAVLAELVEIMAGDSSYAEAISHGIFLNTEDEKDPRNLPLTFRLLGCALRMDCNPRTRDMLIDSVLGYFPIQFASKSVDPAPVAELKAALNLLMPLCGSLGLKGVIRDLSTAPGDCAQALLSGWPVPVWADDAVTFAVTEASTGEETAAVTPLIAAVLENVENAIDRYSLLSDWPRAKLVIACIPQLSESAFSQLVTAALDSQFLISVVSARAVPPGAAALAGVLAMRSAGWAAAAANCVAGVSDVREAAEAARGGETTLGLRLAILRHHPEVGLEICSPGPREDAGVVAALVKLGRLEEARQKYFLSHLSPLDISENLEICNAEFFSEICTPEFLMKSGGREFLQKILPLLTDSSEISRSVISAVLTFPAAAPLFAALGPAGAAPPAVLRAVRGAPDSFAAALGRCELSSVDADLFRGLSKEAWIGGVQALFSRAPELGLRLAGETATPEFIEGLTDMQLISRLGGEAESESFLACVCALGVSRAVLEFGEERVRTAALTDLPTGGVYAVKVVGCLLRSGEGGLHGDLTAIVSRTVKLLRGELSTIQRFVLLQLLGSFPRVLPVQAILGFKTEAEACARRMAEHGCRAVRRQAADAQLAWFALDQVDSDAPSEGD